MGSPKKSSKKRARSQSSNEDFSDNFRNLKTLFPILQSPEGSKPMVLKNLYRLLVELSSNAKWSLKYAVGSCDCELEICHEGIKVTFGDICELSNMLFKELKGKFEKLFSNLCGTSANKDVGESSFGLSLSDAIEVINLLFRCCILLLTLLVGQQKLILDKGLILLRILRKLSFPHLVDNTGTHAFVFEKSVFREFTHGENGCSASSVEDFTALLQFVEPHNPVLFFKSTMLEVFIDELLTHGQLRGFFRRINEMLFNPYSIQDIGIVIEAMCNHFILSFSDKQGFGDFLSRLFCTHSNELKYPFKAPTLRVTSAVSLLLCPIMVSAPKYMQAHLISLVSEALDIKNFKPDCILTNCFLSTFEKSVILYTANMSSFTSRSSHDIAYPPLEFYVSPEIKGKVDDLITKLDNSSNPNLKDSFCGMKSDLVSTSMRFIKDCQNIYAISCQDEILAILSCLVLKASKGHDDKAIRPIDVTNQQHLYLLASLLKLMSISLIQAIRCLRHSSDSCRMKTLKDFSSCKEYEFILSRIACFRDSDITSPLQQDLSSVMSSHSTKHVDSKMMFLHFLGLMSLSFANGLDCLVKACLLTILALLNLFIFEEGGLDALKSILDSDQESFCDLPIVRFQETVLDQNSSVVVASRFQKIRSLYTSVTKNKHNETQTLASTSQMEAIAGLEEETEETTNGEIFLKCMLKMDGGISNFDDLASFIECKQGKDYSAWLKNRERYRRWKFEKMAVLRWKKKKKTWKTINGKKY
ncbi:hypothetical protein CDL12_21860 [Handroanthus impetiginosus]|uniref:DUF7812 domain-containing protein n=1 Tax=Handroanthus impetiginosus TaxID=429701 RepID=A0A2G9GJW6_9LAMI|nr:hypothetical protein CDL12_21860 [Handroanthus impetiginosus]